MQAFSAQEYKVQMIKTERKNNAANNDLTKGTEQLQGSTIQENVSGTVISLTTCIYWSHILVVSCMGTDKYTPTHTYTYPLTHTCTHTLGN